MSPRWLTLLFLALLLMLIPGALTAQEQPETLIPPQVKSRHFFLRELALSHEIKGA